jgi:hypothetical protein
MATEQNREAWLNEMAAAMVAVITAVTDLKFPPFRVSTSFPSKGGELGHKSRVRGQCWAADASEDGHAEIFISPVEEDPREVAQILAHELLHAALPDAAHGHAFQTAARKIGFEKPFTQSVATDDFWSWADDLLAQLGEYPHGRLNAHKHVGAKKKQTTRLLKMTCSDCGYTVRVTAKWVNEVGAPHCPLHGSMDGEAPEERDEDEDFDPTPTPPKGRKPLPKEKPAPQAPPVFSERALWTAIERVMNVAEIGVASIRIRARRFIREDLFFRTPEIAAVPGVTRANFNRVFETMRKAGAVEYETHNMDYRGWFWVSLDEEIKAEHQERLRRAAEQARAKVRQPGRMSQEDVAKIAKLQAMADAPSAAPNERETAEKAIARIVAKYEAKPAPEAPKAPEPAPKPAPKKATRRGNLNTKTLYTMTVIFKRDSADELQEILAKALNDPSVEAWGMDEAEPTDEVYTADEYLVWTTNAQAYAIIAGLKGMSHANSEGAVEAREMVRDAYGRWQDEASMEGAH